MVGRLGLTKTYRAGHLCTVLCQGKGGRQCRERGLLNCRIDTKWPKSYGLVTAVTDGLTSSLKLRSNKFLVRFSRILTSWRLSQYFSEALCSICSNGTVDKQNAFWVWKHWSYHLGFFGWRIYGMFILLRLLCFVLAHPSSQFCQRVPHDQPIMFKPLRILLVLRDESRDHSGSAHCSECCQPMCVVDNSW